MQSSIQKSLLAYVMPFTIFIAGLLMVDILKRPEASSLWLRNPEHWVYPLQTILCAVVIVVCWKQYDFGNQAGWILGLLAGVVMLGVWIAPQTIFNADPRVKGFDPTVFQDGTALYYISVLSRFTRLVVVVPLVEEIFWRGFLMRFLIRENFTSLPIGVFQWKSFMVVAVCFMLVHSPMDWPSALICGITYNFVAVKAGSLGACVLAHAVTNLGLGFYIMTTRQWGFW